MNNIALLCIGLYMLIVGVISVFSVTVKAGDVISSWAALIGGAIVVITVIAGWAGKRP